MEAERRREGRGSGSLWNVSAWRHTSKRMVLPLSHGPSPCFLEMVFHYIEQAALKLQILLPQPVER